MKIALIILTQSHHKIHKLVAVHNNDKETPLDVHKYVKCIQNTFVGLASIPKAMRHIVLYAYPTLTVLCIGRGEGFAVLASDQKQLSRRETRLKTTYGKESQTARAKTYIICPHKKGNAGEMEVRGVISDYESISFF